MIAEDQKILFINQAKVIATIKSKDKTSMTTGFVTKKIVVTTRRLLIFESLENKVEQVEIEIVANKKPGQKPVPVGKNRISINEYPEFWISTAERSARLVLDEEPALLKFFQKNGVNNLIKSTAGMVLLTRDNKQKLEVLLFANLKDSFRFIKGLMCAQAWLKYEKYCESNRQQINLLWSRILMEVVQHENSLVLIDPDLFQNGSNEEVVAFLLLLGSIPFAHSFQFRYTIVNEESIEYSSTFIKELDEKIHLITMSNCSLNNENLIKLFGPGVKVRQLMKLNLQSNQLSDRCFNALQNIAKENKKLSYINLAHNQINLANVSHFLEFLKTTQVILNLNLSFNKISDRAVEHIQKFILFALNPPIEEIDFSFNEFSQKSAWRLYLGFLKNFKNHVYMNFMVYPIPFKKEIFSESEIDFPRKQSEINFNMHSALIEEFEQESILNNTMHNVEDNKEEVLTIRFIRQLLKNVRLPKNKQEVTKTLELSNKIQNFVYSTQSVQKIFGLSREIKSFPFEVPPRTRTNFVNFLNKRLNEALLIRDHYSIKYILKSMQQIEVAHEGYQERLDRVSTRNHIFSKRLEAILEFKHNEDGINHEIDELVKESLRLYLEGRGVELLYYLKFYRDYYMEKLINEKYNPEHELYGKMATKNISVDQRITSRDFVVPYEIKIEKKINENFYLHPWQTNYEVLSDMTTKTFVECLEFLGESEKRETFAKYFERIEERVEFIKNEFTLFTYKQFKISYTDLKVNSCRLLFLYKNIQDTNFFLEIPIYIKRRAITCEKTVSLNNPEQFVKKYHISNYKNINYEAKKAVFYNYPHIITRYQTEQFKNDVEKILAILNKIFNDMEFFIHNKRPKEEMIAFIQKKLKDLIDKVRHSIHPEQVKEEIYLHLIGWRKGRYGSNTEVIDLIPWFTMYLKPPLQLEKYLVAAFYENKKETIQDYPLCLVSNINKPTPDDILKMDAEFVERDWAHTIDSTFCELIIYHGSLYIDVHLLDKNKISILVPESKTVSELMGLLLSYSELKCEDKHCFWIYKLDKETQEIVPLTGSEYIGEVMSNFDLQSQMLICRRRLYSREIKYIYGRSGEAVISSIYAEVKFEYLMRGLFDPDKDKDLFEIASKLFVIDNMENFEIELKKNKNRKDEIRFEEHLAAELSKIEANYTAYIPKQALARVMKDKEAVFSQLKHRIGEIMLKQEYLAIYEMKTSFLRHFEHFPEFCSSNYKMTDKNSLDLKVCINCMYIYVQSQSEMQYIKLQKIISIIPKAKYVLISYHKNENLIGQVALFGDQQNILAVAMDLLSYCMMRIKMVSGNLYEINRFERIEAEIKEIEKSLKRVYDKNLEQKLFRNREEKGSLLTKILKMSLTLMDLKEMIYYNESKYIKSYIDRKLYANKSEKKMQFSTDMDEEELRANQQWKNQNTVFQTIFPQYERKNSDRFKKKENQRNEIPMQGSMGNLQNTEQQGNGYEQYEMRLRKEQQEMMNRERGQSQPNYRASINSHRSDDIFNENGSPQHANQNYSPHNGQQQSIRRDNRNYPSNNELPAEYHLNKADIMNEMGAYGRGGGKNYKEGESDRSNMGSSRSPNSPNRRFPETAIKGSRPNGNTNILTEGNQRAENNYGNRANMDANDTNKKPGVYASQRSPKNVLDANQTEEKGPRSEVKNYSETQYKQAGNERGEIRPEQKKEEQGVFVNKRERPVPPRRRQR